LEVEDELWVEVVASALGGAPRSSSPHRTRTAGYPNQPAHPCAHQEHARTQTHSTESHLPFKSTLSMGGKRGKVGLGWRRRLPTQHRTSSIHTSWFSCRRQWSLFRWQTTGCCS